MPRHYLDNASTSPLRPASREALTSALDLGVDAHRSRRLSVGWDTTDDDVDAALDTLPGILERLRALG
jgi:cysteine sulfinate desulfinase/cysteine desulfurase-like protein